MKFYSTHNGFTIIETLVAITILMVAIAGPLTIANKGLLAAVYAHDQVVASYLAQDAMEYVKNARDNNLLNNRPWLNGFDTCRSTNTANPSTFCEVDTINGSPSDVSGITACTTDCSLYKTDNGYVTASNGTRPAFTRYFYISSSEGADSYEAKVVVIVKWTTGTVGNQVLYENEFFNAYK